MQVKKDQIVTLSYTVREGHAQGPILETMEPLYPFKFYYGSGQLLPAFERALEGLPEGGSFEFSLPPEEAYGPVREDHILEVPLQAFEHDGRLQEELLQEGQYITMNDDRGNAQNGKILEVGQQNVRVDFNHSLAGKPLHFKGVVLNIRPATLEEKQRKSYVEAGGVHRR